MTAMTSGASVLHKIKEAARREGREVQALATLFVIERFIARLSLVDTDGRATIKGGQSVGIIFGNTARPTKDLDVNVDLPDVADPIAWCEELVGRAVALDLCDGVVLDVANARFERRDHQGEGGLRVSVPASIHTCRVPFVIDVGVNNEMSFDPTEHRHAGVLVNDRNPPAPIDVKIYPFENTVAEKIVSKIEDGVASIRHKDFFDIWFAFETCKRTGEFAKLLAKPEDMTPTEAACIARVKTGILDGSLLSLPVLGIADVTFDRLAYALSRTAASRGAVLPADLLGYFRSEFGNDETQSTQWANWCRNNRKRLLFQPPGTDAATDRSSSFHVLFDHLEPVFVEINSRLRNSGLSIYPRPMV
ncbi:nucleotidyl transferase AbiEii/AbiGii toxin family protein [Rhizobium laguerreae]|nr:nucleotidyl transferase AbiEii/AbiGii toxin family protein [Rhizobium laguerreae]